MSSGQFQRGPAAAVAEKDQANIAACRRLASQIMTGWRDGQTAANAREVLARHPELNRFKTIVLDLAYEEFCLRTEKGESLEASQYCRQFPDYQKSLQQQIELFWLIERNPGLLDECMTPSWPEPGMELLGYQIIDELGQGAFARVYLASEEALGRRLVAIKVCLFGADEADTLGKLQHPNIVSIYSVQHQEESPLTIICMPYLGRATLCDVLDVVAADSQAPQSARVILRGIECANEGSLAPKEQEPVARCLRKGSYVDGVLHLAVQLSEALVYAHQQGVLHLDLKPSNILLTNGGKPMLLDFNLAYDKEKNQQPTGGTLPYMSPEQLRCFHDAEQRERLDARSDIYSFGVILHEMLYGQLPCGQIPERVAPAELAQHLLERQEVWRLDPALAATRRVHERLGRIVARCLAFDPQDRFQTAAELLAALRREQAAPQVAWRQICRHRIAASFVAASFLLAAAGGTAHYASQEPYTVRIMHDAREAYDAGDYETAIAYLDNVIEKDPSAAQAYAARGAAHARRESYLTATRDLQQAYELSRDPQLLLVIGYNSNLSKLHDEAVKFYERAINEGVDDVAAYNNLGYSHLLRGRALPAFEALSKALDTDSTSIPALHNRALADFAMAKREKRLPQVAVQDIQLAIQLGAGSATFFKDAALMFAEASRYDASYERLAADAIKQAIEFGVPAEDYNTHPALSKFFKAFPELNSVRARHGQAQEISSPLIAPTELAWQVRDPLVAQD